MRELALNVLYNLNQATVFRRPPLPAGRAQYSPQEVESEGNSFSASLRQWFLKRALLNTYCSCDQQARPLRRRTERTSSSSWEGNSCWRLEHNAEASIAVLPTAVSICSKKIIFEYSTNPRNLPADLHYTINPQSPRNTAGSLLVNTTFCAWTIIDLFTRAIKFKHYQEDCHAGIRRGSLRSITELTLAWVQGSTLNIGKSTPDKLFQLLSDHIERQRKDSFTSTGALSSSRNKETEVYVPLQRYRRVLRLCNCGTFTSNSFMVKKGRSSAPSY